jgi:hypothetical protein
VREIIWLENLKGRDHSEDLGVGSKIIRIDLRDVALEVVDWMHRSHRRD